MDHQLFELAQGVFAFTPVTQGYGHTTVGLVIDTDGLTIVDTGPTPAAGHKAKAAIRELTAELELPIKRVVVTSSRIPFSGGSNAFWPAAYYGTEAVSAQLDSPVNVGALHALLPEFALSYNEEFTTRPITHTIAHRAWISGAAEAIPLPGEGPANLVVMLEAPKVVFGGALASFGVTPLAFDGHPEAWARSLRVLARDGFTIVGGHGRPGGVADALELADYLEACVKADGDPGAIGPGPWDSWTDRRFDAVNTERAARLARGDDGIPDSMFALLGMEPIAEETPD
jgi:glyoxylase-like metal-dependent hydrolase (beta-lactamase superfamily II)